MKYQVQVRNVSITWSVHSDNESLATAKQRAKAEATATGQVTRVVNVEDDDVLAGYSGVDGDGGVP